MSTEFYDPLGRLTEHAKAPYPERWKSYEDVVRWWRDHYRAEVQALTDDALVADKATTAAALAAFEAEQDADDQVRYEARTAEAVHDVLARQLARSGRWPRLRGRQLAVEQEEERRAGVWKTKRWLAEKAG